MRRQRFLPTQVGCRRNSDCLHETESRQKERKKKKRDSTEAALYYTVSKSRFWVPRVPEGIHRVKTQSRRLLWEGGLGGGEWGWGGGGGGGGKGVHSSHETIPALLLLSSLQSPSTSSPSSVLKMPFTSDPSCLPLHTHLVPFIIIWFKDALHT